VLDTLAVILKRAGHCVLKAVGGRAALDVFESAGGVDLLLTDVVMPGLNGFRLAREAKARQPAVKVLYISGYFDATTFSGDAGDRYGKLLSKPIEPDALRREVGEALGC
jgi:DNA-binding NtrC family response regulator